MSTRLTPEQYLEIERKAEYRSEYHDGEMFAMAGARWAHNLIVANLILELGQQLRTRPCAVTPSDMRVHVPASGLYTYPDVIVVCGEPRFQDERQDTLLNPTLIVEVLSKSTEAYDRGQKSKYYRSLTSLSAHLLVASEWIGTELLTRQPDGTWLLTEADRLDQTIEIPSIQCTLRLADLYEKVAFAPAG